MQKPIVVVGSINFDLVVGADRIPQVGETIIGTQLRKRLEDANLRGGSMLHFDGCAYPESLIRGDQHCSSIRIWLTWRDMKSLTCGFLALFAIISSLAFAQDVVNSPQGEQIPGPSCSSVTNWNTGKARTCSIEETAAWLADIEHWRTERRVRIGFDASEYDRPALQWTQSSFVQPQMMVHDRYFFDAKSNKYTVDRYLQDLKQRYGGIDSVLIWHTYPNIGIDSRNQFDLFRDLPGGTEGVRQMVEDFHRAGVRVLFPFMVWDRGTHEENTPDWQAMSKELADVNADGINGDTLDGMPRAFRTASDALNHPLALEPENGLGSDEMIAYNNLTWGYWSSAYDFIPSVSRYKWLEARHLDHICNRFAHNHLDDLQEAFFNGDGFESWENIWGIWNQMTP